MTKGKTPVKRARKAEKNRLQNKVFKSKLRTAIKKYETSLAANNEEAAQESLITVTSLLDRCVSKGIVHKNTAARRKSSLAKRYLELKK